MRALSPPVSPWWQRFAGSVTGIEMPQRLRAIVRAPESHVIGAVLPLVPIGRRIGPLQRSVAPGGHVDPAPAACQIHGQAAGFRAAKPAK